MFVLILLWRYVLKIRHGIYWFLTCNILGISLILFMIDVETFSGVFFSEPKDVCAVEGQAVFFPCEYNSTSESVYSVLWRINGQIWSTFRLPSNHRHNATGLVVRIDTSNNQSTYSCIIHIFSESLEDETMEFESNTAVLTVIALDNVSSIGIHAHPIHLYLRHDYQSYNCM